MTSLQVNNKFGRFWFFQEIFLLIVTNIEMILVIPFLTLNDINLLFVEKELI